MDEAVHAGLQDALADLDRSCVRRRLDAELVRRKLARSREQAAALVDAGRVQVRGTVATRPRRRSIRPTRSRSRRTRRRVRLPGRPQAGRGAGRLRRRPRAHRRVAGRRCLDAGASTGGFTDVLLRAGARQVVAVDVGYGQLAWLAAHRRAGAGLRAHERAYPRPEAIGGPVDLTVADLSFISLRLVLPALAAAPRRRGPGV